MKYLQLFFVYMNVHHSKYNLYHSFPSGLSVFLGCSFFFFTRVIALSNVSSTSEERLARCFSLSWKCGICIFFTIILWFIFYNSGLLVIFYYLVV